MHSGLKAEAGKMLHSYLAASALVVWKLPVGQLFREIKTGTQVSAVVWSAHEFIAGTSEGDILRYTADGVDMNGFHAVCDSGVHDLAVDPSGDVIVASSDDGSLVAIDAKDGRQLGLPFHFRAPPELLSFTAEGKVTAYAAEHGLFEVDLFPELPAQNPIFLKSRHRSWIVRGRKSAWLPFGREFRLRTERRDQPWFVL